MTSGANDTKCCGVLSRFFFHERLTSLFIVCQTMLTIGESRRISEANERERQAREHSIQQAAEKRHCSKNGDLKLSSNHSVAIFVFFSNFFLSSFLSHFFPLACFPLFSPMTLCSFA